MMPPERWSGGMPTRSADISLSISRRQGAAAPLRALEETTCAPDLRSPFPHEITLDHMDGLPLNEGLRKMSWIVAFALVASLLGCRSIQQNENVPRAVDVAYQIVIPQGAPRYQLADGEDVQMPELEEKVMPEFPLELITPEDRSVLILTHLVISETGSVDRVNFETFAEGDGLEPFRTSIRKAVTEWRFSPMIIIRAVNAGKGGKGTTERSAKPVSLWYQFQFSLKNGQPVATVKKHSSS